MENPPKVGVIYLNGLALENLAPTIHLLVWNPFDITVNVTYAANRAGAPIPGATVNLLKYVGGVWKQIRSGTTNSSGSKVFTDLIPSKKYKVVVIKSTVDFNGAVTGRQSNVTFANTAPVTAPITLISDTTIKVQQGTPATNGPVGYRWKGNNGSRPTITITRP